MKYKTKRKEGIAAQYTGHNIKELRERFPSITFEYLNSKTTWGGTAYQDLRIIDSEGNEDDLIAGDWFMEGEDNWLIVPMCEFEQYWEEV